MASEEEVNAAKGQSPLRLRSGDDRAETLGVARGSYALQAAITACHARARTAADRKRIAVSMVEGPLAGLELVDALASEPSMRSYHFLPSARADLLAKLGRWGEARAEFERAASLTRNARQHERLLERAAECALHEIADEGQ